MKILVVGDFLVNFHEEAYANAFEDLGHEVIRFKTKDFFKGNTEIDSTSHSLLSLYFRFQNKYHFGPTICKLNNSIIKEVEIGNYSLVFFYRPVLFFSRSIKKMRSHSILFSYNNDDPFSANSSAFYWRNYLNSSKYFNHNFCYRNKNIKDFNNIGIKNVSLLRSHYLPSSNFYISKDKAIDVVFIGHFENDGRDEILLELLKSGFKIKIYGPEWKRSQLFGDLCKFLDYEISPLRGETYNDTLNSAKIALVFLSKLNNDTYTRRCFEIPSTKTLMLSEYTEDLAKMFQPNEEAVYFSKYNQLKEKLEYLLNNPKEIERIGINGYNKLLKMGHTPKDRVLEILEKFNKSKV
jgi:spore maturation protein CgeB